MDDVTRMRFAAQLERDEGRRNRMYLDSRNVPTIGVGHNLRDRAISEHAIDVIRDDDILATDAEVLAVLSWAARLSGPRYGVLLSMAYNLGAAGLLEFRRMLEAIQAQQWERAADEMRDSEWARQVGRRAVRLEQQMLTDTWYGMGG